MSASATPQAGDPAPHHRTIPSRPTTPLRPTSRSSFRASASYDAQSHRGNNNNNNNNRTSASAGGNGGDRHVTAATPLEALEPAFAELSDGMADLEANFMHLQLMHESLARFSESFAAFLYGLNMNAFCVDFPEAPLPESFRRQRLQEQAREAVARMSGFGAGVPGGGGGGGAATASSRTRGGAGGGDGNEADTEATFLTTDTSFVEHPPSSRKPGKFQTPVSSRASRGGIRGGASGIARGRGRGGIPRAGGIPRGVGRARGGRG